MAKKWFESKTLWANLGALVTSLGLYLETGDFALVLPAVMSVVNIILRLVTKTPITK